VFKWSGFRLSKWYLDGVDENGTAVIIYVADLSWKMLTISYAEVLEYDTTSGLRARSSIGKHRQPELRDDSLRWSSEALGIEGTWRRLVDPVSETLLSTEQGDIIWDCCLPAAASSIRFADGRQINGFGYGEHLTMSIKPWRLPINELRWGRYFDGVDSIIWIDWRGSVTQTWAFHNGKSIEWAVVDDDRIVLNNRERILSFHDKRIIRDGTPISEALAEMPLIRTFLPTRTLNAHECKWLSRGKLTNQETESREGWVIHEVVRWN
jgi:hypothetical protein